MKRITAILVLAMAFFATSALAATHAKGGCGFHRMNAPIGFRWWTSEKMAIDLGVGVTATEAADLESDESDATTNLIDFAVDAGLPIMMRSWERVHVLFRPGINWSRESGYIADPEAETGYVKDNASTMKITAEIEGEVFIADNFSVSASHGVYVSIFSPPGDADSSMDFGTMGDQITELGFHMYFLGGN